MSSTILPTPDYNAIISEALGFKQYQIDTVLTLTLE